MYYMALYELRIYSCITQCFLTKDLFIYYMVRTLHVLVTCFQKQATISINTIRNLHIESATTSKSILSICISYDYRQKRAAVIIA